jgi:hypothetical protein
MCGTNQMLQTGIAGYHFCNAAEILRSTYTGWPQAEQDQFKKMTLEIFYKTIQGWGPKKNGNWDAYMTETMMSIGIFADKVERYAETARRLYDEGRRLRSGSSTDGMRPNPAFIMPDGNQVSLSDVVVNEIESEYMKHGDIVKAMRSASGTMLEESCSICIFADRPGVIGFINMNQRVGYSFEEDGVYLGTTRAAFPGSFMEIPGNSVGYVTAEGVYHREELGDFCVDTAIPDGLLPAAIACIRENPGLLLGHLCDKAIRPAGFIRGKLDYHALAAYRTIETLISAGMVRYEESFTPGSTGVEGRSFKWYLK